MRTKSMAADPTTEGESPIECNEMQPNATLTGISPRQVKALMALVDGQKNRDAAGAAGVDRTTLYRWLTHNAAFKEEYNRRCRELRLTALGALERLAPKAIDCMEKAIGAGDPKASSEVLRHLERLTRSSVGADGAGQLALPLQIEAAIRDAFIKIQGIPAEREQEVPGDGFETTVEAILVKAVAGVLKERMTLTIPEAAEPAPAKNRKES